MKSKLILSKELEKRTNKIVGPGSYQALENYKSTIWSPVSFKLT